MNQDVIAQLREEGFKVRVHHLRATKGGDVLSGLEAKQRGVSEFAPKGGSTIVELYPADGTTMPIIVEMSRCSKKDNFCRSRGLQIALGRALKRLRALETEGAVARG